MIPAATMARIATLGLSAAQAIAVAEMMAEVEVATETKAGAAIEARRASDRERKSKQRHGTSRDVTGHHVKGRDGADPSPPPALPPEPPNPPTPTPVVNPRLPSEAAPTGAKRRQTSEPDGFAEWYGAYPHKVARDAAAKAFGRVMQSGRATLAELIAGVERYRVTKPPDREWCHPATWLNQGRWADEPAESSPLLATGQGYRFTSVLGGAAPRPTSGAPSAMAGILAVSNRR